MNFTVAPGSRIARLPRALRWPALVARNLVPWHPANRPSQPAGRTYAWSTDGLATDHYCPFLDDDGFERAYRELAPRWYADYVPGHDFRWRLWILTRCARQAAHLDGAFVEFGAYRGGTAFMALSAATLDDSRRFYLFDTFAGAPSRHGTEREHETGLFEFAENHAATSPERVSALLERWRSNVVICPGDVMETVPATEVGAIAYCHFDINASAPTRPVLEYAYPRAVPGAHLLFDDYGFAGYEDQRRVVDEFFAGRREQVIALPTGQALAVKL